MALDKLIIGQPGIPTCGYHHVWDAQVTFPPLGQAGDPRVRIQAYSWESEGAKAAGGSILWNWVISSDTTSNFTVPLTALADIETYLAETEGSPFFGATVIDHNAPESLSAVRQRKWSEIKKIYNQKNYEPLTTAVGVVDADEFSQFKILQAVALANNLAKDGQPVMIPWSMSNNTIQVLDTEAKVVGMGYALAQRELELRVKRNQLRELINTPEATIEQIQAINWNSETL